MSANLICRGCGTMGADICTKCEVKSETWNACQTCGLSCPREYCIPCNIEYKKTHRCETCGNLCRLRWCGSCFNQRRLKNYRNDINSQPLGCRGCGRPTIPNTPFCYTCRHLFWFPCSQCYNLTPYTKFCLYCVTHPAPVSRPRRPRQQQQRQQLTPPPPIPELNNVTTMDY